MIVISTWYFATSKLVLANTLRQTVNKQVVTQNVYNSDYKRSLDTDFSEGGEALPWNERFKYLAAVKSVDS